MLYPFALQGLFADAEQRINTMRTLSLTHPPGSLLFSRLSAGGAAPQAAAIVAALAADGAAGDTECSVPARQE